MQVGIRVLRHVIVKNNVDSLDIHASAKQISGHQNPLTEILECLITSKTESKNAGSVKHLKML